MNAKLYIYLTILVTLLSSCSEGEVIADSPFKPGEGIGDSGSGNCDVELVNVKRIRAEDVTENAEIGDYFFTLKSLKTIKEKISVEGRYAKNGVAVEIVTKSSKQSVGIDETIIIRINSDNINSEEDFNCMEYVIKVEVKDSEDCEFIATDC